MPTPTVTDGTFPSADVYRNLLHKRVSIRQAGKVVAHANHVIVRDVEFRVRPAGVQRIRKQGQREVVAYARGTAEALASLPTLPANAQRVCFNPFEHEQFVLTDGTPVVAADALYMTAPCGSWVVNPR